MTLYLGENIISGSLNPTEPTRNLGQIIESILPLTDAGLHLLDGALIQGSGIYSAFVTKIGKLSYLYPSVFVTEEDWQTSVNTYGVCGKFVYNANDNTVRLPKITGIIEGTTDLNALGDLVEAGLPFEWLSHTHTRGTMNITGGIKSWSPWGAFYQTSWDTDRGFQDGGMWGGTSKGSCSFDASRSWSGSTSTPNYTDSSHNNSTVQPQTIKMFYYIVIATTAKTEIQTDIDEIATDLNNKVDLDGTNATFPHIVETYVNGTSGYNLYSNGYCEQWGKTSPSGSSSSNTITFMKPFIDSNYSVSISINNNEASVNMFWKISSYSNTQLTIITGYSSTAYGYPCWWKVCGYIN